MGPEIILTLLVIAGFVYAIGYFFSTRKEDGEERRPPVSDRPRRSAEEMDRFLAEMNRRRQQAATKQAPPVKQEPARPVEPSGRGERRPPAKPTPVKPQVVRRQEVQRPKVQPSVERSTARPVVAKAIPVAVPEVVAIVERPAPAAAPTVNRSARKSTSSQTAGGSQRRASPGLVALASLMRTKQSLQTAFVLKEIFGPPLMRRRKH